MTAVAWVFIALSGFTTFTSVLQNVMVNTLFPLDQMKQAAATVPGEAELPAFFRFVMDNVRFFFAFSLVVSASMLGAAVGMLKRRDWARRLFIGFLSLGIAWNLGGLVLQFFIMEDFTTPAGAPTEFAMAFSTMRSVIVAASLFTAFAVSGLFAWLTKRLASAEVRGEFS